MMTMQDETNKDQTGLENEHEIQEAMKETKNIGTDFEKNMQNIDKNLQSMVKIMNEFTSSFQMAN